MPRGDGTGPNGSGPMTGRGLGYCSGSNSPGFAKGPGMGIRRGFGGRGNRFRFFAQSPAWQPVQQPVFPQQDKNTEITVLEQQKNSIEQQLENINKRLGELKK
ncbi:hypothetical protein GF327_02590 [Candidatus Woesearchaeota archaeon]|nr:hypothetical protein [Candidatus Woesearchaeota archaeon]